MWKWTLNWGDVRGDLVIGSCPMTPDDVTAIRSGTGATALLSLQTDECRGAFAIDLDVIRRACTRHDMAITIAPMRDFDPPDQRRNLPTAVAELLHLLALGNRVYVHCTAGINRAPLTVLAYLTYVEELSREDALARILAGRPQAEPYWEAYDGCWNDLVERLRESIAYHAYMLAEREPLGTPEGHWWRAEREVVRNDFLGQLADRQPRRDPHRG